MYRFLAIILVVTSQFSLAQSNVPDPSPQARGKWLLERLTGVKWDADSPVLQQVVQLVGSGDMMGAAAIAVQQRQFYDVTAKQVALPMSTREETLREPMNDFAATFIGITRDDIDARQMLYGNFYYRGNPALYGTNTIRSDLSRDILSGTNHYADLQNSSLSLRDVLMRVDGQMLNAGIHQVRNITYRRVDRGGTVVQQPMEVENTAVDVSRVVVTVPNPDPAGLLTSAAFMGAHAIAGTNRRLVEYTFREFMCLPIEKWADTGASELRIGRDIDRFPGGDNNTFLTSCKGCHTVMDGFRGAFAFWDSRQGVDTVNTNINHSQMAALPPEENTEISRNVVSVPAPIVQVPEGQPPAPIDPPTVTTTYVVREGRNNGFMNNRGNGGVVNKMNRNDFIQYSGGFVTTNDSFVNNASRGANAGLLGWRGLAPDTSALASNANGVHAFGRLVANSQRFPRCMAKRIWQQVCRHDLSAVEMESIMAQLGLELELNNYRLKHLFQAVAVHPRCRI